MEATALAALSGAALTGTLRAPGAPQAADGAPCTGNAAPHSTARVTSRVNGDITVLDDLTLPLPIAVPPLGSKVRPGQGGNEHAAPQADGDRGRINTGRQEPCPQGLTPEPPHNDQDSAGKRTTAKSTDADDSAAFTVA